MKIGLRSWAGILGPPTAAAHGRDDRGDHAGGSCLVVRIGATAAVDADHLSGGPDDRLRPRR